MNETDLGLQTSVRIKPVWLVKVAKGPKPSLPEDRDGHWYLPLARLRRSVSETSITEIEDLRDSLLPLAAIKRRINAIEEGLTPMFRDPELSKYSGKTGENVILYGRRFDLGELKVSIVNSAPPFIRSVFPTVIRVTNSEIEITLPDLPAGNFNFKGKIVVENAFGRASSSMDFQLNKVGIQPKPL